jgi:hypothetical protein
MYSGSRSSNGSAGGGLRATWRGSAAWATSADMARSIRASAETAPRIRPIPPPRRPRTSTGSARRCACRSVVCGMKRPLGRLRPYGRGRRRTSVRSTRVSVRSTGVRETTRRHASLLEQRRHGERPHSSRCRLTPRFRFARDLRKRTRRQPGRLLVVQSRRVVSVSRDARSRLSRKGRLSDTPDCRAFVQQPPSERRLLLVAESSQACGKRWSAAHVRKGARGAVAGRRSQQRGGSLWGPPDAAARVAEREAAARRASVGRRRGRCSRGRGRCRPRAGSVRCMGVARDGERRRGPFAWLRAYGRAAACALRLDRGGTRARGACP